MIGRWAVLVAAGPALLFGFADLTLTVTVHDSAGRPIPGASARLISTDHVLKTAAGELLFTDVEPGTYDLEVSARGFSTRIYPDIRIAPGTVPRWRLC